MLRPVVWTVTVLLCVPLLAGCGDATPPASSTPSTTHGARELPRIDLSGIRELVARESAEGRIVVIDFWATWCVPCVEMFPHLHSGLKALGDRVVSVSISFDSDTEASDGETYEAKAYDFLAEHGALEQAYLTPSPAEQEAIVEGIGVEWQNVAPPAVYVFGANGELAAEFVGAPDPPLKAAEIVERVRSMLGASAESTVQPAEVDTEVTDG